ncbi:predicted protein [Uncinocarpus reesii 1704]|uniref:Uncharacterized protein n=1 Tax=Uncinocarpus reesii (strain UAMH 1704) TaxID=336963 RepID=C4JZQ9_UNCRE|nr:uncharacterized protein UREG_07660 [Uncinocarpus reesii 1704]EEP82795.1 predicted protein [Uncinocarpus reesii 1704]
MDAIVQQIRELHAQADEVGKIKISNELDALQSSLDSDWDTILKLAGGPLRHALVKIGVDLKIFESLVERTYSSSELVEKTGISFDLLGRILRGQASFGLIQEVGAGGYAANRFTKLFADSNAAGAVTYTFDVLRPIASAFPAFLKERENASITSTHDTVFQKAFDTKLSGFEWMKQHPETFGNLFKFLALRPNRDWVDSFPIEDEIASFNEPDKAILVDVGGGTGDQALVFRKKFPQHPGRVIVQEIPETLALAKPLEGVEFMEHDCFKPNPIQGAKYYYLRYVMHLWQDDKCVEVLKALIPALGPQSRILIDEVVVPSSEVPWQAACQSILMATTLAGAERTLAEWMRLLDAAGLKIIDIFTYDSNLQSVIVAVPKN